MNLVLAKAVIEEFKHLGQALGEMTPPSMVNVWDMVEVIIKDAETPITEEWLVQIGFVESLTPMGEKKWSKTIMVDKHGFNGGTTTTWMVVHDRFEDGWWPIEYYQQHTDEKEPGGVALIPWRANKPTMRGDLLCLWNALRGDW